MVYSLFRVEQAGQSVAGQQAMVLAGTEQTLRRPCDGPGEAGVMLCGHGFIPTEVIIERNVSSVPL